MLRRVLLGLPLLVSGHKWVGPPIVRVGRLYDCLGPALAEDPVGWFWVLVSAQGGNILGLLATVAVEDESLGPVDFDVVWGVAAAGVVDIGAADIGHLVDHVILPVVADEVDADVLHTIACSFRLMGL